MILQGRNLIIKSGSGMAIAAAKSCSVEVEAGMLEVSSPTSGKWKTYIDGRMGWQVSIGSLIPAMRQVSIGSLIPAMTRMVMSSNVGDCFINFAGQYYRPAALTKLLVLVMDNNSGIDDVFSYDATDADAGYFVNNVSSYSFVFVVAGRGFVPTAAWVTAFATVFGETITTGAAFLLAGKTPTTHWSQQSQYSAFDTKMYDMTSYIPTIGTYGSTVRNALLKAAQPFTLDVVVNGEGYTDVALTGTAWCRKAHIQGTVGNLLQGSFEFLGNGPLSEPTTT